MWDEVAGGGGGDARGALSSSARFCRVVYYAPSLPLAQSKGGVGLCRGRFCTCCSRLEGLRRRRCRISPYATVRLWARELPPPRPHSGGSPCPCPRPGFWVCTAWAGLCLIHHHPLSPPLRFRLSLFPLRFPPLGFLFSGCTPHERSRPRLVPAKAPASLRARRF